MAKATALHCVHIGGKVYQPGETISASAEDIAWLVEQEAVSTTASDLPQLDHDQDGEPGGSFADEPPALTGKNKAELLEIAAAEGVDVSDEMTKAEIVEAIELGREADNSAPVA